MAMGLKRKKNRRAYAFHYKPADQKVGFTFQGRLQETEGQGENAVYLYKNTRQKVGGGCVSVISGMAGCSRLKGR